MSVRILLIVDSFSQFRFQKLRIVSFSAGWDVTGPIGVLLGKRGGATAAGFIGVFKTFF